MWQFVGGVSAMIGLVCFPLGSTYHMSLGKLGNFAGIFVYLLVCIGVRVIVVGAKRIRVPEKAKDVVEAILFVVISSISMVLDDYGPEKSDAYTSISYGSFALMSLSLSRKLKLGFETGFTNFFLQLFAAQLFKIKWFLFPISLFFCSLFIGLRHYPKESELPEVGSITPNNGSHPPPYSATTDIESLISQRQILLATTNNQENNEAESSQASMDRSPSIGQVPKESIMLLDRENQQNREEVPEPSMNESWNQDHVSSRNNAVQPLIRREIPNISQNVGDTLAGEIQSISHNAGDGPAGGIQNISRKVGEALAYGIQSIPRKVGLKVVDGIQNLSHNVGGTLRSLPQKMAPTFLRKKNLKVT